ncbi:DUF3955 domain-containing protein [Vagococcus coleopterorum]|uniref:DUF3955 domain-containing protein n=1 Tax=Vagococcus coleopterorum TaxID=2714946 RepID=A0A6G8AL50_9ENTE|nr:DUF3955 domain-containing protein [Vagococcus coleopterorum]QIL45655.1 DUF3955 domain-containing protein [Vagococcus coleopterorum]
MDFGAQVKHLRTSQALTQEELAQKLNVSRQTISSWENNRNLPDLEMVVTIAKTFDLSLDKLILGDDDMEQKLIKDGSDVRKSRNYKVAAVLFLIGALCFVAKTLAPETIDADGILHEPFFLIPIGYLFVFIGIGYGIITFIRSIIRKQKKN